MGCLARLPGRYNREERLPTARPVLSLVALRGKQFSESGRFFHYQ